MLHTDHKLFKSQTEDKGCALQETYCEESHLLLTSASHFMLYKLHAITTLHIYIYIYIAAAGAERVNA